MILSAILLKITLVQIVISSFVKRIIVLVICQKALVHIWGDPLNPQMREERMVQFGINTIIFALTQEGSITHRVMDEVR